MKKQKIALLLMSMLISGSAIAAEVNTQNNVPQDENSVFTKKATVSDDGSATKQLEHETKSLGHDAAELINKGQAKLNEELGDDQNAELNRQEALKHKEASDKEDAKADAEAVKNKAKISETWDSTKETTSELWNKTKETTKDGWDKTSESAKAGWEAAKDKYNDMDKKDQSPSPEEKPKE